MTSVSSLRKLKAIRTDLSIDSERNNSDLFDDKRDDSFSNATFSTLNSGTGDDSGDLDDAKLWTKLSSVPKNTSQPLHHDFFSKENMSPNILRANPCTLHLT